MDLDTWFYVFLFSIRNVSVQFTNFYLLLSDSYPDPGFTTESRIKTLYSSIKFVLKIYEGYNCASAANDGIKMG